MKQMPSLVLSIFCLFGLMACERRKTAELRTKAESASKPNQHLG